MYVHGRLSGHSTAAASVVVFYRNSDHLVVFGANHLNSTNYFSSSMDHVTIYSQSFGDVNMMAAVYAAVLNSVARYRCYVVPQGDTLLQEGRFFFLFLLL